LKGMVQGGGAEDHHASRQLWHNDTMQSIYEFPQAAGGPIYFPSQPDKFINWYAQGQRPVLPGSGDQAGMLGTGARRPTYYMRMRKANGAADNTLGYVFSAGDTAWMLTSTALVLLMTMPGTKHTKQKKHLGNMFPPSIDLFFFLSFPFHQASPSTTRGWSATRTCWRARCKFSSSAA